MRIIRVCIKVFLMGLFIAYIFNAPVHAENWYDYYTKSIDAAKKDDWKTVIVLLKKAIDDDPEPGKRKKYGMRAMTYYPYLELGKAYLAVGDMEAAYHSCKISESKGIAPQKAVADCLAIALRYMEIFQIPLPTSTPESPPPTPTPTLTANTPPALKIISTIPTETELDTINVQGVAMDHEGIKEVKISVENLGITGITSLLMPRRSEEQFNIAIPLDFGRSTITIEALDTTDQIAREVFVVDRKSSLAQVLPTPFPIATTTPRPVVPPTPFPTATPTLRPTAPQTPFPTATPTLRPDTRPSIKLTSVIPAETEQETLEIQGVATDDIGVQDVNVRVVRPGEKGLTITSTGDRTQKGEFKVNIQLNLGPNNIVIEARDTIGQTTREVFTVVRKAASTPSSVIAALPITPELRAGMIKRPEDVYAVIIGIGDYQDERIPDLCYTVNDAQGFYEVLTDPNYGGIPKEHIKLLLNQEATDRNIKGAIGKWLSQQAKKEDTVIIYYSGHGAPEGRDTYWVTYNADIDDLYTTALNNNDIADMLDKIKSDRVITFLDSCYSAATVQREKQTRGILTEIPWEKFSGKGRVAISASDGKQLSLELDEYGHGVFTYYLLEGMRGNADKNQDGVIEVEEIWDYVKYQVTDTARKAGNPQTPVFQGIITAGIPLTFNIPFLQEKQRQQIIRAKQEKLAGLFEQGLIKFDHFECALKILDSGETNRYLEGLLSGKISPEVFTRFFRCTAE